MREIKLRAWAKDERVMHPKWEKLDDENGQYILMQFTGMTDVNEKEIWEGDIIFYDVGNLPVYFDDGMFCYKNIDGDVCGLCAFIAHGVEVIGNIYEHPELLTKD
jgi:uncharacterized phage protein (TIGR01671 family)